MKKIGLLTSGGDAPGMNATIRSVVRAAQNHTVEVLGICHGYKGLIEGLFLPLDSRSVANTIQRGGTLLKSSRSPEFRTNEGMQQAYNNFKNQALDALVVVGGDGTFRGALEFERRFEVPVVGLPGTIDNDIFGTDFTIGFDTAVNNAVDAVDKIRDTANSHDTVFFVEVMGRDAGFIALHTAVSTGAEAVLIPESPESIDDLYKILKRSQKAKKTSMIIIVAEGEQMGGTQKIADEVAQKLNCRTRVTILGHIQRGGAPTAADRILASRLGYEAIEALINKVSGVMIGTMDNKIVQTPFDRAVKQHQDIDRNLLRIADILSR